MIYVKQDTHKTQKKNDNLTFDTSVSTFSKNKAGLINLFEGASCNEYTLTV